MEDPIKTLGCDCRSMRRVYNKSMMDRNPDIAGIGLIMLCSNAQLVDGLSRQPVRPGKLSVKYSVSKLTIAVLALDQIYPGLG
ncbi:uncharacterized protein PgNI_03453 [Pyricularia grisea]|uniref:Uncharacterized protein n=1 Tax=Pyricularia grisea TaxID=148305 RepID=A0A6P8BAF3_PYRGI|nr:uncharacterized protein PgNI_03453 [Pyricularia grisea]TLD12662.1 hypothetical protein PgNI_03453 [Pyricularia grisea]